jgi:hypothetical protein
MGQSRFRGKQPGKGDMKAGGVVPEKTEFGWANSEMAGQCLGGLMEKD